MAWKAAGHLGNLLLSANALCHQVLSASSGPFRFIAPVLAMYPPEFARNLYTSAGGHLQFQVAPFEKSLQTRHLLHALCIHQPNWQLFFGCVGPPSFLLDRKTLNANVLNYCSNSNSLRHAPGPNYYILDQEFPINNFQLRCKNFQMDVLGRVLVLSRKSGLSQVS